MTEVVKLKFPVFPENLPCASVTVVAIGSMISLGIDRIEELKQAVLEGCFMVMRHAYESGIYRDRDICIIFRLDADSKIEVTVKDKSDAFDPQRSENRSDMLLSMTIIDALMNNVKLEHAAHGGSRLTMTKYLYSRRNRP